MTTKQLIVKAKSQIFNEYCKDYKLNKDQIKLMRKVVAEEYKLVRLYDCTNVIRDYGYACAICFDRLEESLDIAQDLE